jgi:hypothetical protein
MRDDVTTTERLPWETDLYLQRLSRWQLYNEYKKNEINSTKFSFFEKGIWK